MAETVAAPAPCCPKDSHGMAKPPAGYEEKGKVVSIGGNVISAYVVSPEEQSTKAILVFHDIFGWDSGRTKVICDEYASKGYHVVMPYIFNKDNLLNEPAATQKGGPGFFGLMKMVWWLQSYKWKTFGSAITDAVIPYLTNDLAVDSIGVACYCWGCYPMLHLLAKKIPTVKCAVGFHPSVQTFMALFERSSSVLKEVETPFMCIAAGSDPADIKAGGFVDKAMRGKACYKECVFKEYPDMLHGWVNRGDLAVEDIKRDYEDAMSISDNYFAKHL